MVLATAIDVITSNSGPSIAPAKSAGKNHRLTLGRLELANADHDEVLSFDVTLYLGTSVARPMKQTLISKISKERPTSKKIMEQDKKKSEKYSQNQTQSQSQRFSSQSVQAELMGQFGSKFQTTNPSSNYQKPNNFATAGMGNRLTEDGENVPMDLLPTYRVQKQAPLYRESQKNIAEKLLVSMLPLEKDEVEPTPIADDDKDVFKAYKLGKDNVRVEKADQFVLGTKVGIEILNFYYEDKVSRLRVLTPTSDLDSHPPFPLSYISVLTPDFTLFSNWKRFLGFRK